MIPEGFRRKLAAIFSADVQGYSRLMDDDEEATIRTLKDCRKAMSEHILQYRGRVIDSPGDNILADFSSMVDAINCAVTVQRELTELNTELPGPRQMRFRIGINLGDVIDEDGRIYGDGVNIAARVEGMAEAGGICITGSAYDKVQNKLGLQYEYLGEHQVKNIRRPIRVYRVKVQSDLSEKFASPDGVTLPLPDKPSIVILPFINMSGDSEQEYFSDGITEDIITALSRSHLLFVISRDSSFAYREKSPDVRQVNKELNVRYILKGSVRKAGNRVRITTQLIDGIDGKHVWAEKYDGKLQNVFYLQDQITQQVVATLLTQIQMNIGDKPQSIERPDVGTWDLLARGWKLMYEITKDSFANAEILFRRAVAASPNSCDAHAWLAIILSHQVWMGYASHKDATISEACELAKRAIALDERNEYAHWVLGFIHLMLKNHYLAVMELERAVELNPNCSLAYGTLGTVLSFSGEPEKSIKNNEIAIRLNPMNPSIFFRFSGIAMAHFMAGRYSEAVQWARKSIHRKPTWSAGHAVLISSLGHLKLLEDAKQAVDYYLEIIPDATISELRNLPFKNPDEAHRFVEGLRKAGLPESGKNRL